jgi:hypothetical protein
MVLKAIDLSAGRGYYRTPVEIQVSRKDDTTTVVFRRPTSNRMASRGRKPTKTLCTMTFVGADAVKEIVEEGARDPAFDRVYSKKTDQDLARAARAACEYLWRNEEFKAKEFAVKSLQGWYLLLRLGRARSVHTRRNFGSGIVGHFRGNQATNEVT